MTYQNFHKHSYYTNIIVPDSTVSYEDYAKRAVELEHGILSSCEHGWQGNYYEVYETAKRYGLKFIFGTEAYWVKDRFQKDGTNSHICIFAKNENGRLAITEILSEANITGFYKVPRIDIPLIMSLPPKDVLVTTACIGFYKYGIEDSLNIIGILSSHFEENFYLEVQYHDFKRQIEINRILLDLKLPIIMGCDSHYILQSQHKERDNYLYAKGIVYQDEKEFIIDYPSLATAIERFENQNILNSRQIEEAIKNTNIFLEFQDIEFSKDIKLPSLYPDKTQNEKNELLKSIIYTSWNTFKKNIDRSLHQKYLIEIKKELDTVINTEMADYFLLDYEIVQEAIRNGGIITNSGRGSSVSFIINTLLGFSKVDRISAKVQMFPERFMSETRILQTKSLPDLDLNLGNPEVFFNAQTKILGEECSYPMIAYGNYKKKSAFKLYAKSQNMDFVISNIITTQIDNYENNLKHAEEDMKDSIDIYNYIDEEYHCYIKESEKYQNIISDKKIHPCASLIYQGNIKREFGLLRIKNKQSKTDYLVTIIDGKIAEKYKFLKNDLLKVDVVNIIHRVYQKIGLEQHTINELIELTKDDKKTWNIYSKGITVCINQVEKEATKQKIIKYKPQNISELTAFVAAIRPSFQSMYQIFENRESFSYNIDTFDNLIKTDEIKDSFVIYQEQIMATLAYSGIDTKETYGIIKSIAKKKEAEVKKWKDTFLDGFTNKILETESISRDQAYKKSLRVWQIIDDSCAYGFNASHAYCVACDSLYEAYLKANYTLEFFEVILNYYSEKNEKDKLSEIKTEAINSFNIKIQSIKFRSDNRDFKLDKDSHSIHESIPSIKSLNRQVGDNLYNLKDNIYNTFFELLFDIKTSSEIQQDQLDILIRLNYFQEFGNVNEIQSFLNLFNQYWQKASKSFKKQLSFDAIKDQGLNEEIISKHSFKTAKMYTKLDCIAILKENLTLLPAQEDLTEKQIIDTELELLGYIKYRTNNSQDRHKVYIIEIDTGRSEVINPKVKIYSIANGNIATLKIKRKLFKFNEHEIIYITDLKQKPRYEYLGEKNGKPQFKESKTQTEWWIEKWIPT
jgi:DNA polymerase III alpha subunit